MEEKLWYCKEWEIEDSNLSGLKITKRAIGASLDGLVDCLTFTVEGQDDFPDSWLPTLDISLKVDGENIVLYRFFEKPTTSQVCLQANTALSQNGIVQALVEDTKRRLLNTSSKVSDSVKREIMDKWAQKMLNSGHGLSETRRNIISGIKGYYTKLKKAKACGKSIHQSAKSSEAARRKKKLVGKNFWFRQENKTKEQEVSTENNAIGVDQPLETPCWPPLTQGQTVGERMVVKGQTVGERMTVLKGLQRTQKNK